MFVKPVDETALCVALIDVTSE